MNSVVSREEWLKKRIALLEKEKAFNKRRDALTRERQALSWVKVDKSYVFEGREGKETLADLFNGCSQFVVYHFMYHPSGGGGSRAEVAPFGRTTSTASART